jgi:hypothetical protein
MKGRAKTAIHPKSQSAAFDEQPADTETETLEWLKRNAGSRIIIWHGDDLAGNIRLTLEIEKSAGNEESERSLVGTLDYYPRLKAFFKWGLFSEIKNPGHTGDHLPLGSADIEQTTMGEELTEDELITLARTLRDDKRDVAIRLLKQLAAGEITARENTARATEPPRLKWETDRRPNENPAAFAWRAYAVEAAAGTLHRGVIHAEDPELHRRLNSWLRSHPMPEAIDIPTKPEWNTRQIEAGRAKPAARPRTEGQRLYDVNRVRRQRHLTMS